MRLTAAANQFIADGGGYKTEQSQRSLRHHLKALQATQPGLHVHQFTEAHLRAYCLKRTPKGPPAPKTIRTRRSNLSAFYSWATYAGLCPTNPAANLRWTVRDSNEAVSLGKWLTEDQVGQVLAACPDTSLGRRDQTLLRVGFTMGIRVTSLSELRWQSFTPDLSVVSFIGKGNKPIQLGVPATTRQSLLAWREEAKSSTVLWPIGESGANADGVRWTTPLQQQGIRNLVDRAGRRVGIQGLCPHDLRRTFAGLLEAAGVPIDQISKLLCHADLTTTQRYLERSTLRVTALGQSLAFAF